MDKSELMDEIEKCGERSGYYDVVYSLVMDYVPEEYILEYLADYKESHGISKSEPVKKEFNEELFNIETNFFKIGFDVSYNGKYVSRVELDDGDVPYGIWEKVEALFRNDLRYGDEIIKFNAIYNRQYFEEQGLNKSAIGKSERVGVILNRGSDFKYELFIFDDRQTAENVLSMENNGEFAYPQKYGGVSGGAGNSLEEVMNEANKRNVKVINPMGEYHASTKKSFNQMVKHQKLKNAGRN